MMSTGPGDSTTKAPELHGIFLRTAYLFPGEREFFGATITQKMHSVCIFTHIHNCTYKQKITEKAFKQNELSPVSSATKKSLSSLSITAVDGRNPKQPPGMCKTLNNRQLTYHPQLVTAGFLNHLRCELRCLEPQSFAKSCFPGAPIAAPLVLETEILPNVTWAGHGSRIDRYKNTLEEYNMYILM